MSVHDIHRATARPYVRVLEPASLKPILDRSIAHFLYSAPETLLALVERYGSPLNIVWPHTLRRNVGAMRAVLREHQVRHEIFYGAKVNKSQALVRAAVECGIGVDVSSLHEMRDALRAGADPARLCATGPAKTAAFHAELLAAGALVSVDSLAELGELEAAARAVPPARPARILLRYRPTLSRASRFGIGEADAMRALHRLALPGQPLRFDGFHFHLSGYAHETRVQALREVAGLVAAARALGLAPRLVDVGGGMPIRYVEGDDYAAFLRGQDGEHYRNGKVPASFYPYGGPRDACDWLDSLLAAPCTGGQSVAGYLRSQDLTLALEPGRSLADQGALTVFKVTRVKPLEAGRHVIFVEGSSFSACETWFGSEFLVDPLLVSAQPSGEPGQAWIAGHSCLDDDVITNRLLRFTSLPRAGDLLVYANTAAYQMDLLENAFHRHPMPRRIAAAFDGAGGMDFLPDDRTEQSHDSE